MIMWNLILLNVLTKIIPVIKYILDARYICYVLNYCDIVTGQCSVTLCTQTGAPVYNNIRVGMTCQCLCRRKGLSEAISSETGFLFWLT